MSASHPDDPGAPLVDRLLLALGISPRHAAQAGDDETVEAAVLLRTQAHKFPMVVEDWGVAREELDALREAAVDLCVDLSSGTYSSPSLDRLRDLLGFADASSSPTEGAERA